MNSSEVARMLGVSISTVQRWVKQLELPMDKNERGHYIFNEENVELLKTVQEQIQNGALLQDIAPLYMKKPRKGIVKQHSEEGIEKLSARIGELEVKLNAKADSVASYQLLQHRQEIEELQNQIQLLCSRIEVLENERKVKSASEKPLVLDQPVKPRKVKKKNIVRFLFGF